MKNKKIFLMVTGLAAASLIIVSSILYRSSGSPAGAIHLAENKPSYWTCGMHPQVKQDKPGNCPICNMKLIPVYDNPVAEDGDKDDNHDKLYLGCGVEEEGHCPHCDGGDISAKCVCGGHSYVIAGKGLTNCPVCEKPLTQLTDEAVNRILAKRESKVVSRLRLTGSQKELGDIRTESLENRHLSKTIRTAGEVAYDPDLFVAEEEYLTALETVNKVKESSDPDVLGRAKDLLERSRSKLILLGLNDALITEIEKSGKADKSLTLPDDHMWVYASIYEYEIGWVKTGMPAGITTYAFPGENFTGDIHSINPVLDPKTRSLRIRIRVANPDLKLKPRMYADVVIESMYNINGSHEVLAVPEESVLDTGKRKIVYIESEKGEYLGIEVKLGPIAESMDNGSLRKFYPVLEGLAEGDNIVTRGNFLIDSQSQLSGNMSVLYGGAREINEGTSSSSVNEAPVETKHRH